MPKKSLNAFCKEHGVAKTTAHQYLRDHGFDTSNGLNDVAIAALADHFRLARPVQPQPLAPQPEAVTTTFNSPSPGSLALPQQPGEIALGTLGGGQLADFQPEDIDRFLSACDGFQQAIDADWERQQQLAKRKADAAAKVKAKVEAVRQSATLYQARSDAAAMLSQQLDQELAAGMGELGKFAAQGGGSNS